ncbi:MULTISPECIES: metal/formaldehyde-sensitive transcriptional repressor [Xanthomonas]|uniref:Metal/formaldehyde-sensitive transcriptional repressor n=1 Tax=Xanthomonas dyei TaxID=743699 RepID=A0ABZ0D7A3_9XANT|nr:metal/formaldehyde-sensitive transcriptional repressor [Xanthomonas dyei]WOB26175.1 metal/formaldehyde-sensitive transcriptional repressor [Xanthomonas dyei]WOB53798.1 metal/formaldehyde-sensitive transcriptional repressor [Xanthomonas dyei]
MSHLNHDKSKLLARVRKIRGQVEGLEKALAQDVDCTALLTQVAAFRGAAQGLMVELLSEHLKHHVAAPDALAERELAVDDVAAILKTYLK